MDKTLKLWDLASGKELRTFTGHSSVVSGVAIAPDGRTALSGSSDKTLKLWDLVSGKELRTFTGHSGEVLSVAIAPDGRTALSGGTDMTLKLWDLASGREATHLQGAFCLGEQRRHCPGRSSRALRERGQHPEALGPGERKECAP